MGETSFLKRDLVIFRGTYEECMNQPTEDMKIYLAWDTQEIFVGNRRGKKVQYGISKSIITELDSRLKEAQAQVREDAKKFMDDTIAGVIEKRFDDLKRSLLEELLADFEKNVKNSEAVADLTETIERLKEIFNNDILTLEEKIENQDKTFKTSISTIQNDIQNLETRVNDEIKTNINTLKEDVTANAEDIKKINESLNEVYNKTSVDDKDSQVLESSKQYTDSRIEELDDTVRLITDNKETLEKILADDGVVSELSDHNNRISALELKVPELESSISAVDSKLEPIKNNISENKTEIASIKEEYATRDFVNSSINSMAAEYITNSEGAAFPTKADLLSGPWYRKTWNVSKNELMNHDYAIVLNDESQTDQYGKVGPTCRYTFSKDDSSPENSQWQFQYRINETPFTSDQLNAINSGMTISKAQKITEIGNNLSELTENVSDFKNTVYTKAETFTKNEVNSLVDGVRQVPSYTSSDYGKVLGLDSFGNLTWIKATTGGETVTKKNVQTTLSISLSNYKTEISGTPFVLTVSGTASNNSNGCAVNGDINIQENGYIVASKAASQEKLVVTSIESTRTLDIKSAKQCKYTINATKKSDTEDETYSISGNGSSATLVVYQPTLLGYGDDTSAYSKFDSDATEVSISGRSDGSRLFMYTQNPISSIIMGPLEYAYDDLGTTTISINETTATYHKYDLQTIYDSSNIKLKISY